MRTTTVCILMMLASTIILASCASTRSTTVNEPRLCYRITPLRVKYGVGIQVKPGFEMAANACGTPKEPPRLSVEDCIRGNLEATFPGGGKIVFEEDSVRSACEKAVQRGPQLQ
jgi:hypothetical protein